MSNKNFPQYTKIFVRFPDNDFINTWRGVMMALQDAYNFGRFPETREDLFNAINEIAYPMYLLYQGHPDYEVANDYEFWVRHSKNYLRITQDNLLVGDEVDQFFNQETNYDLHTYQIILGDPFNNEVYIA